MRNCDYALIFEALSPKLAGECPWTIYHRLGPPAGPENTYNYKFWLLCIFAQFDILSYYAVCFAGEKVRNCDYALVLEATSPKLTGAYTWTINHRLGPPAGPENPYN